MQFPKPPKPIRLKGQKKKDLQRAVIERDRSCCNICGIYTQEPPHHIIPYSQGGSDIPENMAGLCGSIPTREGCHYIYHHGKDKMKLIGRMIKYHGILNVVKYFLKGKIADKPKDPYLKRERPGQ